MITEFKTGDLVTYFPYETEIPMYVIHLDINHSQDLVYYLHKNKNSKTATTITTPKSIKESRYFEYYKNNAFK